MFDSCSSSSRPCPPQRVVGLRAGRVGRDRGQVALDRVGAVAQVLLDRGQVVRRDARLRRRGVAVAQGLVDGPGVVEAELAVEVQPRHQRVDGEARGQQTVVRLGGAPVRGVVGQELRPGRVRAGQVALLQAHRAAAVQGEGVVGDPGRDVGERAVPLVRLRVAAGVLQQQPALQQRALQVEGGRGGVVPDRLVVAKREVGVAERGPQPRPRQQRLMPGGPAGAEVGVVCAERRLRLPARRQDAAPDQRALRGGDRRRAGVERGQGVGGPPGLVEAQQQPDLGEVGVAERSRRERRGRGVAEGQRARLGGGFPVAVVLELRRPIEQHFRVDQRRGRLRPRGRRRRGRVRLLRRLARGGPRGGAGRRAGRRGGLWVRGRGLRRRRRVAAARRQQQDAGDDQPGPF